LWEKAWFSAAEHGSDSQQNSRRAFGFALSLQSLVDSGHVSVKDVGSLAQVLKERNQGTIEDSIWSSFRQREYPLTQHGKGLSPYLERKGYRWLYKYWSTPIVKRRPPPQRLGPPSCSLDDLVSSSPREI